MERIGYNARSLNYWCAPPHGPPTATPPLTTTRAASRVFVAIVGGMAAGVMGMTGLVGFLTFFATSFLLSLAVYMKMERNPRPFFKNPNDVWTEGISQALMVRPPARRPTTSAPANSRPTAADCAPPQSYILFWTLFYDIVHIY